MIIASTGTDEVLQLLNLDNPIVIGTLPMRLLAELVGQVQYEEDDPKTAALTGVWPCVERDFNHLARQESSKSGIECLRDNHCFYVSALTKSRQFDTLSLQKPLARIIHPEWKYKYLVFIEGRKFGDDSIMLLILKINKGARHAFLDRGGRILPRTIGVQLAPKMGPADEYQIAMLLKVILNQHKAAPPSPVLTRPTDADGEVEDAMDSDQLSGEEK